MSETFDWVPSYGSAKSIKPNVQANRFGDGYEQRVALGINTMPRKWNVVFNTANIVSVAIEAFLVARAGREAFHWTPTGEMPGKWVCREWSIQPTGPHTRSISGVFEEVFEV